MLKKILVLCFVVPCFYSTALAYDIYDWRAGTEKMCNQGYQALRTPILQSMAGGRPENLVVKKLEEADWISGLAHNIGTDLNTADIIVSSLVHSMFIDKRLHEALNLSRDSYKEMFKRCSSAILKYDPDGRKTEIWRNQQLAPIREENERLEAQEQEKNIAQEKKQEEKRQIEKEINDRGLKGKYTVDGWAYMLQLEKEGCNIQNVDEAVVRHYANKYPYMIGVTDATQIKSIYSCPSREQVEEEKQIALQEEADRPAREAAALEKQKEQEKERCRIVTTENPINRDNYKKDAWQYMDKLEREGYCRGELNKFTILFITRTAYFNPSYSNPITIEYIDKAIKNASILSGNNSALKKEQLSSAEVEEIVKLQDERNKSYKGRSFFDNLLKRER